MAQRAMLMACTKPESGGSGLVEDFVHGIIYDERHTEVLDGAHGQGQTDMRAYGLVRWKRD